jgi:hypothetical protein
VRPTAPPGGGVFGIGIPDEFLEASDDFFESGYESEEEDEYP